MEDRITSALLSCLSTLCESQWAQAVSRMARFVIENAVHICGDTALAANGCPDLRRSIERLADQSIVRLCSSRQSAKPANRSLLICQLRRSCNVYAFSPQFGGMPRVTPEYETSRCCTSDNGATIVSWTQGINATHASSSVGVSHRAATQPFGVAQLHHSDIVSHQIHGDG